MNEVKQTALVTGSSRGIGAATVRLLATKGYQLPRALLLIWRAVDDRHRMHSICYSHGSFKLKMVF